MKILVFGKYDAEYSRNAVLIEGLRRTGVQVIECRVSPIGVLWPLRLLAKYIMMRSQYDAMLVAFPGQEVMVLARLLTRRPIVFDAFTSHYEGYVEDRAIVTPSSLRARWLAFIDKVACTWSDAVLTDTSQHAQYLHKRYGIPLPRITAVFVGTLLQPVTIPERHAAEFIIHFHGSNVPLQGIDVIWRAMRRLWNERVRFQMIGPFVVPNELRDRVSHISRVPFSDLATYMTHADVCLGIFGVTSKASRVIPNKVFEAITAGRPVITGDSPAIRELLDDESAVLVPMGDADALARAIISLRDDAMRRDAIVTHAHQRLSERATPEILGRQVANLFQSLL